MVPLSSSDSATKIRPLWYSLIILLLRDNPNPQPLVLVVYPGLNILEKLDYLIEYLLKENKNIKINETPSDEEAKKRLYRSLCNIREPRPIKEEYIKIENEYLQEKLQK